MEPKTFAVDIDGTITENGGGRIHLGALSSLRQLTKMGHRVIFVSGRSSVEAFLLSIFGGTTKIAVGENGGVITLEHDNHILLGNKKECLTALNVIKTEIPKVIEKKVFPRMTEVVLERTFDLKEAEKVISSHNLNVELSDSLYAFHINSRGINKGYGFERIMKDYSISKENVIAIGDSETDIPLFRIAKTSIALGNSSEFVKSQATISVKEKSGDGVIQALDMLAPNSFEV